MKCSDFDVEARNAVDHLIEAGDDPGLVQSTQPRPAIEGVLLEHTVYLKVFGIPTDTNILAIEPFAPHADKLKSAVLTTPAAIAAASSWDLHALGIPRPIVGRLRSLASVYVGLDEAIKPYGSIVIACSGQTGVGRASTCW